MKIILQKKKMTNIINIFEENEIIFIMIYRNFKNIYFLFIL